MLNLNAYLPRKWLSEWRFEPAIYLPNISAVNICRLIRAVPRQLWVGED